jgi:hypothetical protein
MIHNAAAMLQYVCMYVYRIVLVHSYTVADLENPFKSFMQATAVLIPNDMVDFELLVYYTFLVSRVRVFLHGSVNLIVSLHNYFQDRSGKASRKHVATGIRCRVF